ncbi:MAG: serine/threonine-protein kinase [Verrucomicrobiota bacterium]|nr:serine/threonine-protein kinase [Verrucomicrobiota bacterium]
MDSRKPELPYVAERYRALKVLGGGMAGTVYLALDEQSGEDVALKEFFIQEGVSMKFLQELSNIIALDHPNLVKCIDVIYGHQTKNYLVYDLIEGGHLRSQLAVGEKWPLEKAIIVVSDIARGLDYAHSRQFIHRDLKPENVLVSPLEGSIVYKISDFGIARYLGDQLYATTHYGSPAYMAPEQFYDEYSYAVDLYSLGIMFYELMAGQLPFRGPPAKMMMAHLRLEPDLTLIHDLRCRELIRRLLSKNPKNRPSSARHVLDELQILAQATPDISIEHLDLELKSLPKQTSLPHAFPDLISCPPSRDIYLHPQEFPRHIVVCANDRVEEYDLVTGTWKSPLLHQPALAVCNYGSLSGVLFATSKEVLWAKADKTLTPLFSLPGKIQAMAVSNDARHIALATGRQILIRDLDQSTFKAADIRNYTVRPSLVWLTDHTLAISSGPVKPRLHLLNRDAKPLGEVSLPGPASCLWERDGEINCLALSLSADSPSQVLAWDRKGVRVKATLRKGIYQAFHSPGILITASIDHVIEVFDENLDKLAECYLPDVQILSAGFAALQDAAALLLANENEFSIKFLQLNRQLASMVIDSK